MEKKLTSSPQCVWQLIALMVLFILFEDDSDEEQQGKKKAMKLQQHTDTDQVTR